MKKIVCIILVMHICHPLVSQNLDARIFRFINKHHSKTSDDFWGFQSNSVKPAFIAVPAILLGVGYLQKNALLKNNGLVVGTACALNLGLTYGLKYTINRDRPYKSLNNIHTVGSMERSPSFPSGHTSSAFTTATALSLAYPKWYVIAPAYLWAGLAGYSRIKLGMHYPSDVAMGALTGAASAWVTFKVKKYLSVF